MDDQYWMERAITLAEQAKNVGEVTQTPAPRKQPNVVVIKEKWNNK